MTTYYMTSKRNNETGYWEQCKATTLDAAKREATREYGAGYLDAVLMIAVGDNVTEERRVIATRPNTANGKWAASQ